MDVKDIRRLNLEHLIREVGNNAAELSRRADTDAAYLSQIRTRTKTPRGKITRGIGDDLARKLEQGMDKPRGWMDVIHPELTDSGIDYNVEEGPTVRQFVPLISWVRAGHWSDVADPFQPGEYEGRVVTTKPHSPRSFALRVVGDSMEPEFPEGKIVTVDPMGHARHRSFVIVRQRGDTEATFKQLIIEGGKHYLKPLNPQYRLMEMEHDAIIVGVVRQQVREYD